MASPEGHAIAPNAEAAFTELFIALCQLPETSPVLSSKVLDRNLNFKFTGKDNFIYLTTVLFYVSITYAAYGT